MRIRTESILHEFNVSDFENRDPVIINIKDEAEAIGNVWHIRKPTILESIVDYFRDLFRKQPF